MNLSEMTEQTICFEVNRVANRFEEMISNVDRPSYLFRPKLSQNGNYWKATYGDVIGVGESPGEAMFHFDIAWDTRIKNERQVSNDD